MDLSKMPEYLRTDPWYQQHPWDEVVNGRHVVLLKNNEISPNLKNMDDAKEWWEREGKYRHEMMRVEKVRRYEALVRMGKNQASDFLDRVRQFRPDVKLRNYAEHAEEIPGMLMQALQHEVAITGNIYQDNTEIGGIVSEITDWMVRKQKPGIMLIGTKGVGKTVMVRAIIDTINYMDGTFLPYVRAQEFEKGWMGQHLSDELVVIDDLGREQMVVKDYGNESTPMADYLSRRHANRLGVIATTNRTPEEIRNMYGEALSDRFNDMFVRIKYPTITSYRKQ